MSKNVLRKNITRRIKLAVSSVMIFVMILASVAVKASIGTGSSKNVYDLLRDIIGHGYSYGVVAEKTFIQVDFESNLATDELIINGTVDVGNPLSYNGIRANNTGNIYIKKFVSGTLQLRSANNIILGNIFSKYTEGNRVRRYTMTDTGAVINVDNWNSVNVVNAEGYMNISEYLNNIGVKAEKMMLEDNSSNVSSDLRDMNNGKIDITKSSEKVCYVNINASEYSYLQQGGLKIYKNSDQLLIINVHNINNNYFNIYRYFVNGESSATDNMNVSNTILWNVGSYEKNVNIGETSGIIMAPEAKVSIATGTCRGRIIAKSFSNPGGELHFLSDDMEKETTTTEEVTTTTGEVTTTTEEATTTTEEVTTTIGEVTTTIGEETTNTEVVSTTEDEFEITTENPYDEGETSSETTGEELTTEKELTTEEEFELEFDNPYDGPGTGDNTAMTGLIIVAIVSGIVAFLALKIKKEK